MEEYLSVYNQSVEKIHKKLYSFFYSYGRFVSHHRAIFLVFGLVINIILIAGIPRFKWVTDLDRIWVTEDTRIIPERDFFYDYFGGTTRTQQFLISSDNVLTVENLDAFLNVSRIIGDPTAPGVITFTKDGSTWNETNFCETPAMTSLVGDPNSFFWLFVRNAITKYNEECNKDPNCTKLLDPLPPGFHYPRLPCVKFTVLDCFVEGSYDFPPEIALANSIGWTIYYSGYATAMNDAVVALLNPGYEFKPSYRDVPDIGAYLSEQFALQKEGKPNNCQQWSGLDIPQEIILGTIETNDQNIITKAGMTRLVHNNMPSEAMNYKETFPFLKSESDRTDFVLDFEQEIIDALKPIWSKEEGTGFGKNEIYGNLDFYFLVLRSTEDMVKEGAYPPLKLILVGYIILFFYASFSLAKTTRPCNEYNKINSRTGLALFGMLLVLIGTLSSFGLAAWSGLRFNFITTNVVPFLALGLGVDDMFILAHTLPSNSRDPPDRRVALALGLSGPSVTLTSFANLCAFFISASVPIPAIQGFCIVMGISVILIWFNLVTMFVAMMSIDTRRIQANRMDCCFCVSLQEPKSSNKLSHINAFMEKKLAPAILSKFGKPIVIFIFLAFFGVMIYGIFLVKPGLLPSDVAVTGSYQEEFYVHVTGKLVASGQFIVTKDIDYPNQQANLKNMMLDVQDLSWVVDTLSIPELSWLFKFTAWYDAQTTTDDYIIPPELFYSEFRKWITGTGYSSRNDMFCSRPGSIDPKDFIWCTDSSINTTNSRIVASKNSAIFIGLENENSMMDAIRDVRDVVDGWVDDTGCDSYAFGSLFLFWEQYLHIFNIAFYTIGYTLLAVFISTYLFQFSPICSTILCVLIFMIDLEILGVMGYFHIKMNAVSVVNLSMSVGLSVEFTAHLAHSFLIHGGTRKERVMTALQELGTPIVNGGVSSLLGVVLLAAAEYPFFRTYYFSMFMAMIIIAFFNGFIFLPVLLSLLGPQAFEFTSNRRSSVIELPPYVVNEKEKEKDTNDQNA